MTKLIGLKSLSRTIQYIMVFIFLFGIASCKEKKVELLIPNEKMVSVLVDLHIAEAAILSAKKAEKDSIGNIYFAQIFEMHEIKDSLFYQNLELISSDPVRTQQVYEKVVEELDKLVLEDLSEKEDMGEEQDTVGTPKKK